MNSFARALLRVWRSAFKQRRRPVGEVEFPAPNWQQTRQRAANSLFSFVFSVAAERFSRHPCYARKL
jgi:hypothetical protein